ncbi:hypothetical protein O3G_MSEX014528 [Manduca sexta]|uniref:TRPM SLOG domain-containing protein n=1 Tax=Manduca sexta TaxID=7130 RepID=A0A921ZTY7_MANSE|nr:hypothetical protein O3G_MSEX014528 [Manduca sexta]
MLACLTGSSCFVQITCPHCYRSKLAVLNNRHAYFLLVDNGSVGRYGAEIVLRRKLEKYIAAQKLHPYTHSSTPVVCLVIEGGTNTVRAVLEYVTDTPPVPVVADVQSSDESYLPKVRAN